MLGQLFRGDIDDHNLIGRFDELLRHGGSGAARGDALHGILLFGDVLQVDGCDDIDAVIAQFLHVLPAVLVAASWRIVFGQCVDQTDVRMADQQRIDPVDDFKFTGEVFEGLLDGSDDNVLTADFAAAAFVEHTGGLAYARSVSQENFEPPATVTHFLRFNAPQKFVGIGAAVFLHFRAAL